MDIIPYRNRDGRWIYYPTRPETDSGYNTLQEQRRTVGIIPHRTGRQKVGIIPHRTRDGQWV